MSVPFGETTGGHFKVIVVDPPWRYRGLGNVGNGGRGCKAKTEMAAAGASAAARYPTLSNDQIRGMNVGDFAAKDAVLCLWITNSFILEEDHPARVIPLAWGFRPVTVVTWVKHRKGEPDKPSRKTGTYFRGASEHFVFAVRGNVKVAGAPATWFQEDRLDVVATERLRHSVKPDEFYAIIEEHFDGPYLDVFARKPREGWTTWGNEVEESVPIAVPGDALPSLSLDGLKAWMARVC